jgi:uncharacterized protein (DUF58 family)
MRGAQRTGSAMLGPEQYLQPDVARRVRRLDLRAKFIAEGFLAGLNDSPYRGLSPEFAEHRKYAPGDDPKTLDWAAWARTDRLFVRTFRAETNLEAYVLVDTSRSMAYAGRPGAMTKLEYATALAAAVGYLLSHQRDAVGLGLLGTDLNLLIKPRTARRHLVHLLAQLARTEGSGPTGLAQGLHAVARRVKRRGLIVLLSDLLDEPEPVLQALRHLAFRGHDLIVFQVLDPMERRLETSGPVVLVDPETGRRVTTDADAVRTAYKERIDAMVDRYRGGVSALGGDFASITTSTPFDQALCRFLSERRRRAGHN